jgi:hypothetical protein
MSSRYDEPTWISWANAILPAARDAGAVVVGPSVCARVETRDEAAGREGEGTIRGWAGAVAVPSAAVSEGGAVTVRSGSEPQAAKSTRGRRKPELV